MLRRVILLLLLLLLPAAQSHGNQELSKKTIILLDTSGSMRGEQLERAKGLILDTLEKRDTQSEFEIYTFAESVSPISSQDKGLTQLQNEIAGIAAGSRTSLYDSISYLMPIAESSGADIVVISDGDDSQSNTSLDELLMAITDKKVRISFLSEFIDARFLASVENIVAQSGGFILNEIPLKAIARDFPSQSSDNQSQGLPWALAVGSGLLSFLILTRVKRGARARRLRHQDKVLLEHAAEGTDSQQETPSIVSQAVLRISNSFNLNTYLTTSRQKFVFLLIAFSSFVLLSQLTNSWLVGAVIALIASALTLRAKLAREENRKVRAFEKELPGALKMLAGSLSAGLSFLQALSAYANDGQGESAREFRRALTEIQLGIPIERALESIATRMKSDDLRWAVSAFAIQREVGGSLATILNSTAETIETRFDLRREVRTLSAEGRISSYILMALPIGIFLFLSFLRPQYVGFFVTEPIGNLLIAVILLALSMAWFWLRSLVRISV